MDFPFKKPINTIVFLILLNAMLQKRCNSLGFWAWFSLTANPGYEILPHLYSLLKPTRTLIARAIVGKLGTPRMLAITVVFEEKSMMMLQEQKKGDSQDAYNYCRFWIILMVSKVQERWRTFSFWVWQGLQQYFDHQTMRDEHDALRKVEFPWG